MDLKYAHTTKREESACVFPSPRLRPLHLKGKQALGMVMVGA